MKTIFITVLTAICLTLTGCGVSQEDYNKLKQENATLAEQVSKITAERDEYKSKLEQATQKQNQLASKNANLENNKVKQEEAKQASNQQTSSKLLSTGSIITNFSNLARHIEEYTGQTVTVEGKVVTTLPEHFILEDGNTTNYITISAAPADYEITKNDRVRVNGIVMGKDSFGGFSLIGHVTSIQRI